MYQSGRGNDPVIVVGSVNSFVAFSIGKNYIVFWQFYPRSTDALMTRRIVFVTVLALTIGISIGSPRPAAREELPTRLTDREFWRLAVESSESDGYFRSDTLTSNELLYQRVIPELLERTRPGGVYLGVGPEQNFTYLAALRPPMAIIFDIRRGNMLVQLMYKALFELARDRAEFMSMLFSRPRPEALGPSATAADLFTAFGSVRSDEALFMRNLSAVEARLTRTHGLPLSPKDIDGIEYAYHAFFSRGYRVRASPSYAELMTQTDGGGRPLSYLSSEASFLFLKDLESKNLVVPVIGDFAGPKAIRAIAAFLKAHGATVRAFYLSNVEQYLIQDDIWDKFCASVATVPLDDTSTFIFSGRGGPNGSGAAFGRGRGLQTATRPILPEVTSCAVAQ